MRRAGAIPRLAEAPSLGLPGEAGVDGIEFVPEVPEGETLRRLDVLVNGRRQLTLEGDALLEPVRLDTADGGLTRVTAVGETADGRPLAATRDYFTDQG